MENAAHQSHIIPANERSHNQMCLLTGHVRAEGDCGKWSGLYMQLWDASGACTQERAEFFSSSSSSVSIKTSERESIDSPIDSSADASTMLITK